MVPGEQKQKRRQGKLCRGKRTDRQACHRYAGRYYEIHFRFASARGADIPAAFIRRGHHLYSEGHAFNSDHPRGREHSHREQGIQQGLHQGELP